MRGVVRGVTGARRRAGEARANIALRLSVYVCMYVCMRVRCVARSAREKQGGGGEKRRRGRR